MKKPEVSREVNVWLSVLYDAHQDCIIVHFTTDGKRFTLNEHNVPAEVYGAFMDEINKRGLDYRAR